jgi:hypothetical protein
MLALISASPAFSDLLLAVLQGHEKEIAQVLVYFCSRNPSLPSSFPPVRSPPAPPPAQSLSPPCIPSEPCYIQAGFDHDPNSIQEAVLDRFDNVTMVGTGASFYRNCFPPGSVDLMFSATAMHWFRKSPIQMKNVLHSAMLAKSDPEFKTYWDQVSPCCVCV